MKKIVIMFIVLLLATILIVKYSTSNYNINYEVSGYKISTKYENNRYYFEINEKYNFDIYAKRKIKKLKINKITQINKEEYSCIIPQINNIDVYPLCYIEEEYVDFHLIDSEELKRFKYSYKDSLDGTFSYNKNLDKKEYIYLWNYKGFNKMSDDYVEDIELFEEGRYDNSLIYMVNNKLLIPEYSQDYIFTDFYLINIPTSKTEKISGKFEISYDAYVVGHIKNKVYLYDNKESNLYEINIKNKKIDLIGSEELGYYKYENGDKISVKKSEYKNKNISYITPNTSNYSYTVKDNAIYKTLNENKKINQKIFEGQNIKIIKENNDILYFISNDIFYKYIADKGPVKIFNYFELNFNTNEIIYIYNHL